MSIESAIREMHSFNRFSSEECESIHPGREHAEWVFNGDLPPAGKIDRYFTPDEKAQLHRALSSRRDVLQSLGRTPGYQVDSEMADLVAVWNKLEAAGLVEVRP